MPRRRKATSACPLKFKRVYPGLWEARYGNAYFTVGGAGKRWYVRRLWPSTAQASRGEAPTIDKVGPYNSRGEAQREGACSLWRDLFGK